MTRHPTLRSSLPSVYRPIPRISRAVMADGNVSAVPAEETQPFKTIAVRVPVDFLELVDKDAERLGITQADWVRAAYHRQLAVHPLTVEEAERYRRPRTRRGMREYAASWHQ